MDQLQAYQAAPQLLKGRVIAITGASDGIGAALAKSCGHYGATVILIAKSLTKLERVYDTLVAAGAAKPAIFCMDFEGANEKDYDFLAIKIKDEFGVLDGLAVNAGWLPYLQNFRNINIHVWMKVMTINLHAPFLLAKYLLPLLETAIDPAIVFTTHSCSEAYWGAYSVAKQAQLGMLKLLANELETDKPIRVNGIDPSPVRTKLRTQHFPGINPQNFTAPEDVVAPFLYFLGPDSKGVTGYNFKCNPKFEG